MAFAQKSKKSSNKSKLKQEETWPLFQGETDETFAQWVAEQMVFPEPEEGENISERLSIEFSINEDGKLIDIYVTENPIPALSEQIVEILERSPDWTPRWEKRKAVSTFYILAVWPSEKEVRLISSKTGEMVFPTFNGGNLLTFRNWAIGQLEYPTAMRLHDIQGRVVVEFIVDTNGEVEIKRFVSSPHAVLSLEVARVLSLSPKWTPGTLDGIPLRIRYTLPVDFILDGPDSIPQNY